MAQNIYDRPEFFAGYSQLPRSVHGFDGAPEWPSVRALLPDPAGKRVVDLGCGFGWFAHWAATQGASSVLGLDLSENMLARARTENGDRRIQYLIADLDHLELPEESFDLAHSALAFHYVADFSRLVNAVHRALTPGAALVFTIEHPIFMTSQRPGWSVDGDGRRHWPVDSYAIEGPRRTDWFAEGVLKQHRTLGTTLNTLIDAGFTIRHVEEWAPTADQVTANPDLAEELERPMFLIVAAEKQAAFASYRNQGPVRGIF